MLFFRGRPVVDVLAEAERRHLDASLTVDQAVSCGQVFVNEAVIGQMLHPVSHLGTDGNLEGESKMWDDNCQGGVTQTKCRVCHSAESSSSFTGFTKVK